MTKPQKKRPSNDDNEFMPVTKRLNLLSIDTSRESTSDSSTNTREDELQINAYEMANYLNQFRQQLPSMAEQQLMHEFYRNYNPSLNCSQNPIYYEANRILYEAHQQRINRSTVHKTRYSPK